MADQYPLILPDLLGNRRILPLLFQPKNILLVEKEIRMGKKEGKRRFDPRKIFLLNFLETHCLEGLLPADVQPSQMLSDLFPGSGQVLRRNSFVSFDEDEKEIEGPCLLQMLQVEFSRTFLRGEKFKEVRIEPQPSGDEEGNA